MESNTHGFVSWHTTSQESVIHASLMQSTLRMRQVSRNHFSLSCDDRSSRTSGVDHATNSHSVRDEPGHHRLLLLLFPLLISLSLSLSLSLVEKCNRVTSFKHASPSMASLTSLDHLGGHSLHKPHKHAKDKRRVNSSNSYNNLYDSCSTHTHTSWGCN